MIEKNIGNIERLVRLVIGFSLGLWAIMQPSTTAVEWIVVTIAMALILNGVFSRCYLWWVFDRNTHDRASSCDVNKPPCS
ncbi:MAG: hypothetical protein ACI9WS_002791 [Paraglaciecola psychrophila]|jgi:hypothetical protein